METAFKVKINDYNLTTGFAPGVYRANANDPKVPSALPIKSVIGLDNIPVVAPIGPVVGPVKLPHVTK